jgi:hypothetical protein
MGLTANQNPKVGFPLRACLGFSGMKGNEGHWGGGISIISQNFSKSPSILFHPLESYISQTSPEGNYVLFSKKTTKLKLGSLSVADIGWNCYLRTIHAWSIVR